MPRRPAFIAGRVAKVISKDGVEPGRFGEIRPAWLKCYEIRVPVAVMEFDWEAVRPVERDLVD